MSPVVGLILAHISYPFFYLEGKTDDRESREQESRALPSVLCALSLPEGKLLLTPPQMLDLKPD